MKENKWISDNKKSYLQTTLLFLMQKKMFFRNHNITTDEKKMNFQRKKKIFRNHSITTPHVRTKEEKNEQKKKIQQKPSAFSLRQVVRLLSPAIIRTDESCCDELFVCLSVLFPRLRHVSPPRLMHGTQTSPEVFEYLIILSRLS